MEVVQNGWKEWGRFVLEELKRLSRQQERTANMIDDHVARENQDHIMLVQVVEKLKEAEARNRVRILILAPTMAAVIGATTAFLLQIFRG